MENLVQQAASQGGAFQTHLLSVLDKQGSASPVFNPVWRSNIWMSSWDGSWDTRACVSMSAEGFQPVLEKTYLGKYPEFDFGDALPNVEEAIQAALSRERAWHEYFARGDL